MTKKMSRLQNFVQILGRFFILEYTQMLTLARSYSVILNYL